MYQKLSEKEEIVGREIVDIAISIHKQLGPGLLESVYAKCFYHELVSRKIGFEKERLVAIW
jgi:GxxExxY protein